MDDDNYICSITWLRRAREEEFSRSLAIEKSVRSVRVCWPEEIFRCLFFPSIFRADGNLTDSKRQHGKNGKNISFQRWRNFLSQEIATHRSLRFLFTWCACRFEGTLFIHYSIEYDFNSFDFNLAKNNKSSWRKKSILRTVEHELLVLCFRTSNCQFVKIEKCSCLKKLRGKQDRISFSILYLDLRLNE